MDEDETLHTTEGRLTRRTGMALMVTATRPSTLVSNTARQSSRRLCSTGRYSESTPALFTSTRRSSGNAKVAGSVTSIRATVSRPSVPAAVGASPTPSAGFRMVATVSNPRLASSTATARPMPRLAPVTSALPPTSIVNSPLSDPRGNGPARTGARARHPPMWIVPSSRSVQPGLWATSQT